MRYAIRITRGKLNRHRCALTDAKQWEAVEPGGIRHLLQVGDEAFQTDVARIPIRQAAAALVIANKAVRTGKVPVKRAPDRGLPIQLHMGEPIGRFDQRQAVGIAGAGPGNRHIIITAHELNFLVGHGLFLAKRVCAIRRLRGEVCRAWIVKNRCIEASGKEVCGKLSLQFVGRLNLPDRPFGCDGEACRGVIKAVERQQTLRPAILACRIKLGMARHELRKLAALGFQIAALLRDPRGKFRLVGYFAIFEKDALCILPIRFKRFGRACRVLSTARDCSEVSLNPGGNKLHTIARCRHNLMIFQIEQTAQLAQRPAQCSARIIGHLPQQFAQELARVFARF